MSNLVIIMKNKIKLNFLTLAFWSTHTFPFEINIYKTQFIHSFNICRFLQIIIGYIISFSKVFTGIHVVIQF